MTVQDRIFHAYIISGSSEEEMHRKAAEIAKVIVCSGERKPCGICPNCRKAENGIHPDITEVSSPAGKRLISVDQIRQLRTDAYTMPNDAMEKAYIINDAGAMNLSAQNAFLKILEEPPSFTHFIMTAHNPGELLQTVRSRCRLLMLRPEEEADGENEDARELLRVLLGENRLELLEFAAYGEKLPAQDANKLFCDLKVLAAKELRERKTPDRKIMRILEEADSALRLLRANVSMGHVMGHILSEFIQ